VPYFTKQKIVNEKILPAIKNYYKDKFLIIYIINMSFRVNISSILNNSNNIQSSYNSPDNIDDYLKWDGTQWTYNRKENEGVFSLGESGYWEDIYVPIDFQGPVKV
jgi:hypothetical protein